MAVSHGYFDDTKVADLVGEIQYQLVCIFKQKHYF